MNRVQLPCGVKTPCKGIIYIAKGNALDRVQSDFLIIYSTHLDIHIANQQGDVDFLLVYSPYYALKLLKNYKYSREILFLS